MSEAHEVAELKWHYGPTEWDPQPGGKWHTDCPAGRGEVMYDKDGSAFCLGCKAYQPPEEPMTDTPEPRTGDRVRVTYEGTYLRPSDSSGQPMLLVGDDPNNRWHNILPPHAAIEVVTPGSLAERMAALADRLDASAEGYGGGKFEGWQQAAVMIREELAASGERSEPRSEA